MANTTGNIVTVQLLRADGTRFSQRLSGLLPTLSDEQVHELVATVAAATDATIIKMQIIRAKDIDPFA